MQMIRERGRDSNDWNMGARQGMSQRRSGWRKQTPKNDRKNGRRNNRRNKQRLVASIILTLCIGLVAVLLLVNAFALAASIGLTGSERAGEIVIEHSSSLNEQLPTPQSSSSEQQQVQHESPVIELPTTRLPTLTPTPLPSVEDTGYLALVNRHHAVPSDLFLNEMVPAWPTVPVSFIEGMYLHPTALQAVANMLNSARESDIGSFFVSSGFRGYDSQQELYDDGANSAFALPPGHSEHHTGLAVDIMAVGISQWELSYSLQGHWLADNSYRYGLILRYPKGAEAITGIEFEPWHFRYVGKVHAYYMKRKNMVLEEYIRHIQEQGSLSIEKNGIAYIIMFQKAENGMINLPKGMNFTVSRDNSKGYIITAWEN